MSITELATASLALMDEAEAKLAGSGDWQDEMERLDDADDYYAAELERLAADVDFCRSFAFEAA